MTVPHEKHHTKPKTQPPNPSPTPRCERVPCAKPAGKAFLLKPAGSAFLARNRRRNGIPAETGRKRVPCAKPAGMAFLAPNMESHHARAESKSDTVRQPTLVAMPGLTARLRPLPQRPGRVEVCVSRGRACHSPSLLSPCCCWQPFRPRPAGGWTEVRGVAVRRSTRLDRLLVVLSVLTLGCVGPARVPP